MLAGEEAPFFEAVGGEPAMSKPQGERGEREDIEEPIWVTDAVSTAISSNYKVLGETNAPDGTGVLGHNLATSGRAHGVEGITDSELNEPAGVYGEATQGSGQTFGVHGVTQSPNTSATAVQGFAPNGDADGVIGISEGGGIGVGGATDSASQSAMLAMNWATTGEAIGLEARTDSSTDHSAGVFGRSVQASGRTYGVKGESPSTARNAAGVFGRSTATGATAHAHGVYGVTEANADPGNSQFPSGVRGEAAGSGGVIGVSGFNANDPDGIGVAGGGLVGTGVFGRAFSGADDTKAIEGWASAGSGRTYGVHGRTNSIEDSAAGVHGRAIGSTGTTYGVEGFTDSPVDGAAGVRGVGAATSGGVYGALGFTESPSGIGVVGSVANSVPLPDFKGYPTGVWGHTDKSGADPDVQFATGVYGGSEATSGLAHGVTGSTYSPDGIGVYGTSRNAGGYAVYADGDSKTDGDHEVTGSQTVGDLGASAYLSTDQSIPSGFGGTQVAFDTIVADDRNEFDDTTGSFTCATDGDYRVAVGLEWQDNLAGGTLNQYFVSTNGTTHTRQRRTVPGAASETASIAVHLSRTIRGLAAGDDITILAGQNSGSDKNLQSGKPRTWVTIDKVG